MRGTNLYPFVPSGPEFEIAFFLELGFEKQWQQDGLAGLRFGAAYFMLQQIDVPEWQKNQMIVLEVDEKPAAVGEITKHLTRRIEWNVAAPFRESL